jgi:putative SOS response-associated peptidase YedK
VHRQIIILRTIEFEAWLDQVEYSAKALREPLKEVSRILAELRRKRTPAILPLTSQSELHSVNSET